MPSSQPSNNLRRLQTQPSDNSILQKIHLYRYYHLHPDLLRDDFIGKDRSRKSDVLDISSTTMSIHLVDYLLYEEISVLGEWLGVPELDSQKISG